GAVQESGWWDVTGRPAPCPEGFWLGDDTINVHWHPTDHRKEEQPTDDHPFCLPHQPRRITKRLHHSTGLDRDRSQSPEDRWLRGRRCLCRSGRVIQHIQHGANTRGTVNVQVRARNPSNPPSRHATAYM